MKKFILLVIPSRENAYHSLEDFVETAIPIGITAIAAVLEKRGNIVKIIDGDAENLTFDELMDRVVAERPDYIGSTTMTATMAITIRFYEKLKERLPGVRVIVGGPHVSALAKKTLEEVRAIDIVVKGEGDDTIAELMNAIETNRNLNTVKGIAFRKDNGIVETEDRPLIENLGKLPLPAYHLLQYNLYRSYAWSGWISGHRNPLGSLFTGRGCYGKCSFCATKTVFGQSTRYFPIERIKKEMDLLIDKYKIRLLQFGDDVFTSNRRIVNEICDYIIEKRYNKRLELAVASRTDSVNLSMLKKMRKAGIRWICFGVESGNQKILDMMHKNVKLEQVRDAFKKAHEAGLFTIGNYMIGALGETYETAMDTINLACQIRQDFAFFAIAIPLPGTELYHHCLERNIRLPSWNEFGSVNSPPIPLNDSLNVEQLMELRRLAINKFFKRPSYILRMISRFKSMLAVRDFVNIYFSLKKEAKQKRF